MPQATWISLLQDDLNERSQCLQLRSRRALEQIDPVQVRIDGKTYVNFCSNNYLGLTHHPALLEAMRRSPAVGSGAAGLISGYSIELQQAENELASWKGYEASIILPSGYQSNLAAIQTLASLHHRRPVRFLIDKLAHASLIDGIRATQLPMRVFPHNHLGKLARLLEESDESEIQVVVTESIFSMDGDAADLVGIVQLKQKHPFILLVDEAHATGVFGPEGNGLAAELGVRSAVDVSVVTLSKAMGSIGGAVCGSQLLIDSLLNHARAAIYTTAPPPSAGLLACAAIRICRDEPHRRDRLLRISQIVRSRLRQMNLSIPEGNSPIIPLIYGDTRRTEEAAGQLRQRGILALPIRPPTVPPNSSRLRLTLSCEHSDQQIEQLLEAIGSTG